MGYPDHTVDQFEGVQVREDISDNVVDLTIKKSTELLMTVNVKKK